MELRRKIEEGQAQIGVIGLGYVGLPLVFLFSEEGFPVIGLDSDQSKLKQLRAGRSYIRHLPSERVQQALQSGLIIESHFEALKSCDVILICVPTPLSAHREPDLSYVINCCRSIAPFCDETLVILESTTYPGTTLEIVRPILESHGSTPWVAYSPEREDPNNPKFATEAIPKLVGADDPESLSAATALYRKIIARVVALESSKVAEAAKLLENTFRAVNIALVNELKVVFDRMGIDIWQVVDAAATKPFGFMRFDPGPGLGGHCIPVDPFYLAWKAKEYGLSMRFIEMSGEINRSMPNYVIYRTMRALSERGKGLLDLQILIVGIAYKKNVDDARESPAYQLIDKLEGHGARVDYHDDYLPVLPSSRDHATLAGRQSVSLTRVSEYDAVLIATAHDYIDWDELWEQASLIIDTRGVYRHLQNKEKLVKA
ncbi:MAG: nucleotide sugar dehydrogenase [Myxococcota bacterium]